MLCAEDRKEIIIIWKQIIIIRNHTTTKSSCCLIEYTVRTTPITQTFTKMPDDKGMCCNLANCMFIGCCCTNCGVNCDNFVCLCSQKSEFLCLKGESCLAAGVPNKGCGCITEGDECCKIGCYCCNLALISPKTCCRGAEQILCLYEVTSLPCDDAYVPECTLAYYGLQCAPKCGCCGAGPESSALKSLLIQEASSTAAPTASSQMQRE